MNFEISGPYIFRNGDAKPRVLHAHHESKRDRRRRNGVSHLAYNEQ